MPVYADITKPPAPLPQPKPQFVSEGVTLLPPLSRRGHGPGLIILTEDSATHLDIIQGVPSAFIKWAEEGYTVVEIQSKAIVRGPEEVLEDAIRALSSCDKLESANHKIGIVVYDPKSWNQAANALNRSPLVAGAVVYASTADEHHLEAAKFPVLRHISGSSAIPRTEDSVSTYSYANGSSFRMATPFTKDFNYWAESLSHTRNLEFLKPLMGGPYFDLERIWDEHTYYEFADRSVEHTMSTMVDQPYVNHVPTLTGGIGRGPLTDFYRGHFIFQNSVDTELELISRTKGIDRVVDEFIYKFTHDKEVDWLLPGVPPTFKKLEMPFTAVVNIRGDRLYHEHISWDQGTVLAQLGLMPQYLPFPYPVEGQRPGTQLEFRVPVLGVETAQKMRDRNSVPSNEMFTFQVREAIS